MAECKTCKHKGTNTHICDECTSYGSMYEKKIVTNADHIRAMSDEELAEFLERFGTFNRPCSLNAGEALKWLQSEAEEYG